MRWDESVHEREQVSVEEFPGWVINIRERRHGRPVLKSDGCLQSLPICLSEMPDSPALRQLSKNSKRDVDFRKHMIRRTNWSREKAEDICGKVNPHQMQKGKFSTGRNPG